MTAPEDRSDLTDRRRAVLGFGVGGLVVLAAGACGSDTSTESTTGTGASSGSTTTRVRIDQVPVAGGVILSAEKVVVTQPAAGQFKAFSAICTHEHCVVDSIAKTIGCSCHGSQFSIDDGSVVQGPATAPLPAKTAAAEGDFVVIQ